MSEWTVVIESNDGFEMKMGFRCFDDLKNAVERIGAKIGGISELDFRQACTTAYAEHMAEQN